MSGCANDSTDVKTIALCNARLLTEHGFELGKTLLVQGASIVDIVTTLPANVSEQVDLCGMTLAPGFIDTQVNGGGDVLFNDAPTVDTIRTIAQAHRRFGTTGLLPTLISDDLCIMQRAIAAVEASIAQNIPGVLGIHLEGPYLAIDRRGVHDASKFRAPAMHEVEIVTALRSGKTLLTLAPEQIASDTLAQFIARGAIVAVGHSAATYAQTRSALDAGVRGFTHLYNAMSQLTGREPGVVGAALEDGASWCGIIVDGYHVHTASMRVALAAKPRGKIFLVTDAMPPVGGSTASFHIAGEQATVQGRKLATASGTLAGSLLDMAQTVRNTIDWLQIPADEALRMASQYPADFIGLERSHGRIAPGYAADLVALDGAMRVRCTWIGGLMQNHDA